MSLALLSFSIVSYHFTCFRSFSLVSYYVPLFSIMFICFCFLSFSLVLLSFHFCSYHVHLFPIISTSFPACSCPFCPTVPFKWPGYKHSTTETRGQQSSVAMCCSFLRQNVHSTLNIFTHSLLSHITRRVLLIDY